MSLAAWSVAEQRNVGRFKLYPVCCSAIAQSIPAPHSVPRGESQQNHFWDQINVSLVFFFRSSLSLDALFFFHSLTHFVFYHPLPLPGCRVSLSSCHTGPPTLTHGGREGRGNWTPTVNQRSFMIADNFRYLRTPRLWFEMFYNYQWFTQYTVIIYNNNVLN